MSPVFALVFYTMSASVYLVHLSYCFEHDNTNKILRIFLKIRCNNLLGFVEELIWLNGVQRSKVKVTVTFQNTFFCPVNTISQEHLFSWRCDLKMASRESFECVILMWYWCSLGWVDMVQGLCVLTNQVFLKSLFSNFDQLSLGLKEELIRFQWSKITVTSYESETECMLTETALVGGVIQPQAGNSCYFFCFIITFVIKKRCTLGAD